MRFPYSFYCTHALAQYSVNSVPHPKEEGQEFFVSNPDNILDYYTVSALNQQIQNIDSLSGAEFCIVVVNDYVGDSDFEFALELFNAWGIGKKASNNGLLLFIAKNRREYRFISGYGMESIIPDAYLKRIGEKYLVPYFREGNYDTGVIEATAFIEEILLSPNSIEELRLQMPEATPFFSRANPVLMNTVFLFVLFSAFYVYAHLIIVNLLKGTKRKVSWVNAIFQGIGCMLILMFFSVFIFAFVFDNVEEVYQLKHLPYFAFVLLSFILAMKITKGRSSIIESFKDEEDLQKALKKFTGFVFVPMLLTPLAWFDLGLILNRMNKNRNRFSPPENNGNWQRINRSSSPGNDKKYLDKGQQKEESIKSLRYEIWINTKTSETKLIAWDKSRKFSECPECHYYTLELNKTKTIQAASYSSAGKGEKYDECTNCKHHLFKLFFTIPRKSESSSGGSSSGRSGGGSSSSSSSSRSSGSFGGGSSGGGGAGGRW
ncbi:TPM domain-containing protein [Sphingobacterium hungaricum]